MSGWNLSKGSCWNFTTVLREFPGFQLWGEIWCSQGHSRRAGKETRGLPPSSFLLRLVCSIGAVLPTFMFPSSKWVVPRSSLYFSCWKFGMVLQTEQCWKRWQVSTAVQLRLCRSPSLSWFKDDQALSVKRRIFVSYTSLWAWSTALVYSYIRISPNYVKSKD